MPGPVDRMAGERIAQRCAALVGSVGLVLLFQSFAWLSEPMLDSRPEPTPTSAPNDSAPNDSAPNDSAPGDAAPKAPPTSDEVVIHVEGLHPGTWSRRAALIRGA